jgi:hypothetical protein
MDATATRILAVLLPAALLAACDKTSTGLQSPTVVIASGDIAATVDQFRHLLGDPNNGGTPGQQSGGRREINWDGVPDSLASPHFLPADFFNGLAAPRARGAIPATPGAGLQVSASSNNPTSTAVRFGNFNPAYVNEFRTFSPERLFSPVGSNVVDLTFYVAGTSTPAIVTGFGAVYTGVDLPDTSGFEFFDKNDRSLGRFAVPMSVNGLSFLGVKFYAPVVHRVRIRYGNAPLGAVEGNGVDVAVMDDFIFGEPHPIP